MNEAPLTKENIRAWLESIGKDRAWLAEQCGTEKGTVDSWFSKRGFPDTALATIRLLMRQHNRGAEGSPTDTGLIQFTVTEFERIEAARKALLFETRPPFYRAAILDYLDRYEAENGKLDTSMVPAPTVAEPLPRAAEEPGTYGGASPEGAKE